MTSPPASITVAARGTACGSSMGIQSGIGFYLHNAVKPGEVGQEGDARARERRPAHLHAARPLIVADLQCEQPTRREAVRRLLQQPGDQPQAIRPAVQRDARLPAPYLQRIDLLLADIR